MLGIVGAECKKEYGLHPVRLMECCDEVRAVNLKQNSSKQAMRDQAEHSRACCWSKFKVEPT